MGRITQYRFDGLDGAIIGVGFFVGLVGGFAAGLEAFSFAAAVALPAFSVAFRRALSPHDSKLHYRKTPRARPRRIFRMLLFTFGTPLALLGLLLTHLRSIAGASAESWAIALGMLGTGIGAICWGLVLQRRVQRRAERRRQRKRASQP